MIVTEKNKQKRQAPTKKNKKQKIKTNKKSENTTWVGQKVVRLTSVKAWTEKNSRANTLRLHAGGMRFTVCISGLVYTFTFPYIYIYIYIYTMCVRTFFLCNLVFVLTCVCNVSKVKK